MALGSSEIGIFTTFILTLSDTLMNGLTLRNIVRLRKQGTDAANKLADRSLKYLALKEFMELLIPLVYCLSFTGSYIGPNNEIMGGIGLDMWHHKRVSSLLGKMQKILYFMSFEAIRGASFSIVLLKFYGLNMYTAYRHVLRNFGWLLLFYGACVNQMANGYYFKLSYTRIRIKYIRLFPLFPVSTDLVLNVI